MQCCFYFTLSSSLKVALNLIENAACYKQKVCGNFLFFFKEAFTSISKRAILTQFYTRSK